MGFWRDIGSTFGVCDEESKSDREERRKSATASITHHPRGCNCTTCMASDINFYRKETADTFDRISRWFRGGRLWINRGMKRLYTSKCS